MFKVLLNLALCIKSISVFAEIDFESPSMIDLIESMEKDHENTLRSCAYAAEQGELVMLENLGDMRYFGIGVDANAKEAKKWFSVVAEQYGYNSRYL
jgi:TPR repeat protein